MNNSKLEVELELDSFLQFLGPFEGIPETEEERAKQKDGIILEKKKGEDIYQIIKRKGKYYGKIIEK